MRRKETPRDKLYDFARDVRNTPIDGNLLFRGMFYARTMQSIATNQVTELLRTLHKGDKTYD